jgi:hypothetical protein
MLRFVQHDSRVVIPNALFCHSERMRGIQYGCFTALSMTAVWSFRTLFFVIPNAVRNPVWMLHCAQHDSRVVIPHALFCHSERQRGIQYGCFASLSMTNRSSVLYFGTNKTSNRKQQRDETHIA